MNSQSMHALLERAKADKEVELALRAGFAKADADAIVRLGAAKGCFVSHNDAALFVEVAGFVKDKELTEAELDQVVGAGLVYLTTGTSTTTVTASPPPPPRVPPPPPPGS